VLLGAAADRGEVAAGEQVAGGGVAGQREDAERAVRPDPVKTAPSTPTAMPTPTARLTLRRISLLP
jgi:hypothetical protein